MAKNFTEAYRSAGYELRNPRNSWSAIKQDLSGVALTIWSDEITHRSSEPWVMDIRNHPKRDLWLRKAGNTIRKKHITYAVEHLGGEFDLILCRAKNPNAEPRNVEHAEYWRQRRGFISLEEFDPDSGEFRIEMRVVEF